MGGPRAVSPAAELGAAACRSATGRAAAAGTVRAGPGCGHAAMVCRSHVSGAFLSRAAARSAWLSCACPNSWAMFGARTDSATAHGGPLGTAAYDDARGNAIAYGFAGGITAAGSTAADVATGYRGWTRAGSPGRGTGRGAGGPSAGACADGGADASRNVSSCLAGRSPRCYSPRSRAARWCGACILLASRKTIGRTLARRC